MSAIITAINSITPVGHNAKMTAASVRAGISRLSESVDYYDIEGNPIISASIEGISDQQEDVLRIVEIASNCLETLLNNYFLKAPQKDIETNLLIGVASLSRPGPRYEGTNREAANQLLEIVKKRTKNATLNVTASGSSSAISCINAAIQLLEKKPDSICIIGGIDSLLAIDTLDWFEDAERLKSETFGRNQGFPPGEGVGFMIVETKQGAMRRGRRAMAEITGLGLAIEPSPFLSDSPSKGEGLTSACKAALSQSSCNPSEVSTVLSNLNGEFFRSKQWGYAELRCFGNGNGSRQLWHPADCIGDVGAASGAVLINIAAAGLSRGWITDFAIVICSDDEGECGAVMLKASTDIQKERA